MSRAFTKSAIEIPETLEAIQRDTKEPLRDFLVTPNIEATFVTAGEVQNPLYYDIASPLVFDRFPDGTYEGTAWQRLAQNVRADVNSINPYPIITGDEFLDLIVTTDYPVHVIQEEVPFAAALAFQDLILYPRLSRELLKDRLDTLDEAGFMAYLAQCKIKPGALRELGIKDLTQFQRKGSFEKVIRCYESKTRSYRNQTNITGWDNLGFRNLINGFANSGYSNNPKEKDTKIQRGVQPYAVLPSLYRYLSRGGVKNRLKVKTAEAWQHNCPIYHPLPSVIGDFLPMFVIYNNELYPFNTNHVPGCKDAACEYCPNHNCIGFGQMGYEEINLPIM